MKILITEIFEDWQKEYLVAQLGEDELAFVELALTPELAGEYADTKVLSVFVGSTVDKAVMDKLPQLKFITTRSTGFDHIDLAVAKERGIAVSNVPFYGENTVAEHAMALLLALSRKLPQSFARIEDAQFNYEGLRGWDLKGKKMGIVGGGHIGMNLARMAKGFGMEVAVFDINEVPDLADEIGFAYVPLEGLLATADVISLHLPLNDHTAHILNAESFSKMKKGVYLINTARGGLIDTNALVVALKSGQVAGAGLDVLEGEEFLKEEMELIGKVEYKEQLLTILEDHVLMEMENVIVTPHNAFNSQEAVERILAATAENIIGFNSGSVQNQVG